MIGSIELQVISKILTSDDAAEVDALCAFDRSFYNLFVPQITFILDHRAQYNSIPDVFTFQSEFPDFQIVDCRESIAYITREMRKNKQHIILLETFNKIKDLGSGDVTDAWAYLSHQCDRVARLDGNRPMDIIKDASVRAAQIQEYAKQTRIPTGFAEIDKLMYGGFSTVEELVVLIARTNTGKAQPLWSKVLTPSGWKQMKDIRVGDVVVGKHNDNGRVIQIFPQGVKDYYRVHFDDGTFAECCDDHLWEVLPAKRRHREDKHYGEHEVLMLKDIRQNLDLGYSVDVSSAIDFQSDFDAANELDGYLLGVILGDGCTRDGRVTISNDSDQIWSRIESILPKYNCRRSGNLNSAISGFVHGNNFVRDKIKEYGLMGVKSIDKFIPKQYFTAPVEVRMALLQGLVDTDGYMSKAYKQVWEFDTSSEQLAKDFAELARSLGVKVKVHGRKDSKYTANGVSHTGAGSRHLVCRSEFNPFYIEQKAARFELRTTPLRRSMPKRHCKMIRSVEYMGQTECQCIMLDNLTHTYLTDDYIVTHNTWVMTKMMEAAQKHGFPVMMYSPEMQSSFVGTRFDTWRGKFANSELFRGKYSPEYNMYIQELAKEQTSAYIVEDKDIAEGAVNVSVLDSLVKRYGIKLLMIDGLSYMQDEKKSDRDTEKYKNICMDLFRMSKKYGCAVVITMQANRASVENKDEKGVPFPSIEHAEGSDHPARIATQVFSIRQIFDKHVLDIRLEKSRNAANQKPILSYSWEVNTGRMEYLPGGENDQEGASVSAVIAPPTLPHLNNNQHNDDAVFSADADDGDEVEF